jgi:hypothetical protein
MLTEAERAKVEENLAFVEGLGDSVGGWVFKSTQARQGGFTTTAVFDNKVDVLTTTTEFVSMMEKCPSLYALTLRRLLKLDDEMREVVGLLDEVDRGVAWTLSGYMKPDFEERMKTVLDGSELRNQQDGSHL